MMDYEGMAREILSPLFNPEPHPFQEEWSDAHSMSSETLVNKLAKALESLAKEKDEEIEKLRQQSWNTGEAWRCEQHPDKTFPHGDCIGPGMPDYQGRSTIKSLRLRLARMEEALKKYADSNYCLCRTMYQAMPDGHMEVEEFGSEVAEKALEEDSHE